MCAGVPNWPVQSLSYGTQQSGAPASSIWFYEVSSHSIQKRQSKACSDSSLCMKQP